MRVVCLCKQKTAYEVRISDWSSVVCSSDLARPAPGEPVGLVRLVGLRRLEIAFEARGEFGAARVGPAGVDHAFILQLRGAKLRHRRMLADAFVHQRLRERRLVAFVMAETAIAPHVDHDVALELLAEVDRELAREGHRFGIVAVDMPEERKSTRLN